MSGGFWGRSGNESDEGDLEKLLTNIALIAACDENSITIADPISKRGLLSLALEVTLGQGADGIPRADMNGDGAVSYEELRFYLGWCFTTENLGYVGLVKGCPWLDEDIEVTVDALELFASASVDFDINAPLFPKPTAPIPEPASVVCGLIGLGMIGRYIKRRRWD